MGTIKRGCGGDGCKIFYRVIFYCRPPLSLVSGQESTICDIVGMSAASKHFIFSQTPISFDTYRSGPVLTGNGVECDDFLQC